MKRSLFAACLLITLGLQLHAQTRAVTDKGEEVILYTDGTWKHVAEDGGIKPTLQVNPVAFVRNKEATFLLKSTKSNLGVWIDPKKWTFKKADKNDDAEYEFTSKSNDLFAMMITEKLEIPIESLKEIAFDNARKVSEDCYVVNNEYRTVNGKKMLLMQMNGTIKGVKFSYYGYYFSNPGGTVQLLTYTTQDLINSQLANAEDFLNGVVIVQ